MFTINNNNRKVTDCFENIEVETAATLVQANVTESDIVLLLLSIPCCLNVNFPHWCLSLRMMSGYVSPFSVAVSTALTSRNSHRPFDCLMQRN